MIEQGYDMDPSLLYQDNMSAILLETNGRASSSKRTKHIKVKYFLIKDKVDRESGGDIHRALSNRADVDGHKHKAKARNCLSSV